MSMRNADSAAGGDAAAKPSKPSRPPFTLKPSKQTCMALGVILGGFLVGSGGLYVWQTGQINQLQAQVDQKRADVNNGAQIARRLEEVKLQNEATREKIRYLESSVSAKEYVPTLLKQTEALAKSVNLRVDSVRPNLEPAPEPPTDKEARKNFKPWPYDKLHVDMQIHGSYWNVARFMYRLTEFPKILSVESIQLQPPANVPPGGSPSLTVNLNLTGFIFKADEAASDRAKPQQSANAATAGSDAPGASAHNDQGTS
jgi:Tfp pilus assembly protein PilO